MRTIEADYLVVGAGAMGLAFIDTLVSETTATVVVVDRNDQPGGHWTTAYPFVRLHQPSAYYGVISGATPSTTAASMRATTSWPAAPRYAPTSMR
jgi:cation diffusion facilitator CzcD-associated flavoprotein CzcO